MGQAAHLVLRHQTWHWRRRVPSDLKLTSPRGRLSVSLGTGVLRAARRIALLLDLALEELRMLHAPLDPATLTAILTRVRDDALAADQAERAQQPPDLGFVLRPGGTRCISVPEEIAKPYLQWLAQQGPMGGISDADLRDDLKGRGEGITTGHPSDTTGGAVDEPGDGGPIHRGPSLPLELDRAIRDFIVMHPAAPAQVATARMASSIRATIARGVEGMFQDAARRNDRQLSEGHVNRAAGDPASNGVELRPHARAVLERQALSVLAAVHGEAALREHAPPLTVLTPAAPPPLGPASLGIIPVAQPATAPAASSGAPAMTKPAPTLSEMLAKVSKLKRGKEWDDKSVADATTTARMFQEFRGDVPIDQVTAADAVDFKTLLLDVPSLNGKGRFAKMTIQETVAAANALEQALNDGRVDPAKIHRIHRDEDDESWHVERYSLTTVNKHLNFLNVIFKCGMTYLGRKEEDSIFEGQLYPKSVIRQHRRKRLAYEVGELESLFRSPVWTGCVDDRLRATPSADRPIRDAKYWAPLIGAHQGMRLEEILQLTPGDVGEEEGITVFRIREGNGQNLKTASSVRTIPVHSSLIRLGFLAYAVDRKTEGASLLFPELKRSGAFDTFGHGYSMWWTEYRRAIGIYQPGKAFHSFRTTLNTQLLRRGVNETTLKTLLGHSCAGDMTSDIYNAGLTLADLQRALELWQLDVSHLEWAA